MLSTSLTLYQLPKSSSQIIPQILPILQPNTNPQQPTINRSIRHSPPLNQSLNTPKTSSMLEQPQLTRQLLRKALLSHRNSKNRPEPIRHLLLQPIPLNPLNT